MNKTNLDNALGDVLTLAGRFHRLTRLGPGNQHISHEPSNIEQLRDAVRALLQDR